MTKSIADYFPQDGEIRDLYCDACGGYLDLRFEEFDEKVSDVRIRIGNLPVLKCDLCNLRFIPDRCKAKIIECHKKCFQNKESSIEISKSIDRRRFGFTKIPFPYSADEYFFTPGLVRPWETGFLTPIYFNRRVLSRYDREDEYFLKLYSRTYGSIRDRGNFEACFGINKHGTVFMWLGDVAKFPDSEQYYLMSESRPPEFSVGSEFFDGQISCKISDQSIEDDLLHSRTLAIDSFIKKYQISIAHLDEEVLDLAIHFFGPSTNSFVEWERTSNTLNRIHVESLSNPNLGKIQQSMGIPSAQGGPMRQLSAIIANLSDQDTANSIMLPFFTIYDLRIAFQHLTSADKKAELLNSVLTRLNLSNDASIKNIYDSTVRLMNKSYKEISGIVEAAT